MFGSLASMCVRLPAGLPKKSNVFTVYSQVVTMACRLPASYHHTLVFLGIMLLVFTIYASHLL